MKNRLNTWLALAALVGLSALAVKCARADVTPTPPPPAITIEEHTLVFRDFATIDFAGQAPDDFVPDVRVRWVLVYVNGELHMMPVFKALRVRKPNPRPQVTE